MQVPALSRMKPPSSTNRKIPVWATITPLGRLVEPEVYIT